MQEFFNNFNFTTCATIFAVCASAVVVTQIFFQPIVKYFARSSLTGAWVFPLVLGIAALAAWVTAFCLYGINAIAVFTIGSVIEPVIAYLRRTLIVTTVMNEMVEVSETNAPRVIEI